MSTTEPLRTPPPARPGPLHLVGDALALCALSDLVPERGAAALVGSSQVALFRIDVAGASVVHAVDHRDPFTGANVLARGIVGSVDGRRYVASPLHKQRFDLVTGACLDVDGVALRVWPTTLVDGIVHVLVGGPESPA